MEEKKRRMSTRQLMMVLPVLIIGLSALGFHALGGGGSKKDKAGAVKAGINTSLPEAQFGKDEPSDKLAYYDRARRDSAQSEGVGMNAIAEKMGFEAKEDQQTAQIKEKLAAIDREINAPYVAPKSYGSSGGGSVGSTGSGATQTDGSMGKDVARLEALMKNMQENGDGEDEEMKELSTIMDKLIAVQNPELAKQLYKKPELAIKTDSLFRAIPAVISSDQKARQGSVVELRLLDTVLLSGVIIPRGHLIYGLASFSNQRISLEIKNIRLGNQVIPVNLTVYDRRDAMAGINAPEALLSDAVGAGASDAVGSLGISGFDLTTQIAGAGLDAAKALLTKKIRRVKQNLKAGYPLLIRDNSKK